jgi:hypothetical protein
MDDEDQESTQGTSFEDLPSQTKREIRKLRSEAAGLRKRLQEANAEVLTAKYGEDIVGLIPAEISDQARRVELAERFASLRAPEPQPEPEEIQPSALAALAGPSHGRPNLSTELLTVAEIRELNERDPQAANDLVMQGRYVKQTEL